MRVILGRNDEVLMSVEMYPIPYKGTVDITGRFQQNQKGEIKFETIYKERMDSTLNELANFLGLPWYEPTLVDRVYWIHEQDVTHHLLDKIIWGEIQNCG